MCELDRKLEGILELFWYRITEYRRLKTRSSIKSLISFQSSSATPYVLLLYSAFRRPEISAIVMLAIFALSLPFYGLTFTVSTSNSFSHQSLPTRTPSPRLLSRHPYRRYYGGTRYRDCHEFSHTLTGGLSKRISTVIICPHPSTLVSRSPSRRDRARCPNARTAN